MECWADSHHTHLYLHIYAYLIIGKAGFLLMHSPSILSPHRHRHRLLSACATYARTSSYATISYGSYRFIDTSIRFCRCRCRHRTFRLRATAAAAAAREGGKEREAGIDVLEDDPGTSFLHLQSMFMFLICIVGNTYRLEFL